MAKKESVKKNFIYNVLYQILIMLLPLVTAPYVSRVIGADQAGVYQYTQAFANYFYLFAMLGVNNYGNRAIARVRDDQDTLNQTFWEIFSFQAIVAVVVSAAYIIYCAKFSKENRIVYLMQSFYVVSGILDVNWFAFGVEKFKLTTIRSTAVRILTAICVFVFVHEKDDLWIYTLIMSASYLLSAIAIWPFVLKRVSFVRPTWKGIKSHIKPNLVLFWPAIAVSLYNVMDKLMLGKLSTEKEVAFYGYAERIVQIPNTLILALDNVMMPRMSNLYATHNEAGAKKMMNYVMTFAMCMGTAMAFGLAAVGKTFAPWFYGEEYVRCGYYIFLLSPILIFKSWAGALRTQYIIPTQKDKIYIISLTAGAIVNLLLNLALIRPLAGVGAIIGTIAAEFTVAAIQFYMVRHDIPLKAYLLDGLSFILIGACMFGCVSVCKNVSDSDVITMLLQLCIGVCVFIPLALLYIVRIRKQPELVNEALKFLHIKYRVK